MTTPLDARLTELSTPWDARIADVRASVSNYEELRQVEMMELERLRAQQGAYRQAHQHAIEAGKGLVEDLVKARRFVAETHAVFGSSQHWGNMALLKSIDTHLATYRKAMEISNG